MIRRRGQGDRPQSRRGEPFQLRRGPQRSRERRLLITDRTLRHEVPTVRAHAQRFILGLLIIMVLGTALLATPIAAADRQPTPLIDAVFTAVSAICLTGLVTVDTGTHWSGFGKAVIVGLMQIGALGFLIGASIVLQLLRRGNSLSDSLLLRDGEPALSLRETRVLTGRILVFTLAVEAAGAVIIAIGFMPQLGPLAALGQGVFYAVAGFSNAGFDLTGNFLSLIPFQTVVWFNIVMLFLVQAGALGYLTFADVWRVRGWRKLTLDTKLVLLSHVVLLLGGAALFLALDWGGAMAASPEWAKPMISLFQSAATRSSGFATVNMAEASGAILFVFSILMIIGGAPASTAGGVRLTTVAVVVVAVLATLRGQTQPQVLQRRLPVSLILRALTVIVLFMAAHGIATVALYVAENHFAGAERAFIPLLFEAASAIATDGLSTGITPGLSTAGKIVLVITMFIGRIGPLYAVYALQQRSSPARYRFPEEPVRIG